MSVFKSLKGTFQNVQQDIVDSFRALTSLDSSPRHEKVKQLQADGISLDCGADLLYRYQKQWSELQNHTAESAKKAEEVDSAVTDLFTRHTASWETLCQLEEEASALPTFVTTVTDMVTLIDSLQTDFQRVEEELDKLLNICEEEALKKEKESHLKQLASYKKAKNAEAFSVKAKLWGSLKETSKEAESKRSHAMKERQEAFMEAFTSDMDYYKKHGRTDKLPGTAEFPKVSSLSEISIDDDKKALDDFLASTEEEQHEGGMFIEDDYTADYSGNPHPGYQDLDDDDSPIDFDDGTADHPNNTSPDNATTEQHDNTSPAPDHEESSTDVTGKTEGGEVPQEGEEVKSSPDSPSQEKANGDVKKTDDQDRVASTEDT